MHFAPWRDISAKFDILRFKALGDRPDGRYGQGLAPLLQDARLCMLILNAATLAGPI